MSGRQPVQRGMVFPSPVVILSIIAVAMAAIAFVATRHEAPTETKVVAPARSTATPTSDPTVEPVEKPTKKPVKRAKVYVEVYNNSGITGLAGRVGEQATGVGWQVVGTDNWIGTIPTNTVYYPDRLKRAAKLLALDLGIERTAPADGGMKRDRLTVVLTGELG